MEKMSKMKMNSVHYKHMVLMLAVSFIAMFVLMYAMVDSFPNVYFNLNQAYMAGLMTAPMALIELAIMRAMYTDRRLNTVVAGVALLVLVGCWTMIRQQTAIGDAQFIRSMIPHHASAVLMCKETQVSDPEIKDLCRAILSSQQTQIDQMKGILARLGR